MGARQNSEKVQVSLKRSHVALQAINPTHGDSSYWLRSVANSAAADCQAATTLLQGCSANAPASQDRICSGIVVRPGMKNIMWSKQYAVVTRAGYLHLFDAAATIGSSRVELDALPRLCVAPCTSLSLRDCTVSLADHSPASLKVEVTAHSKLLPSTRYTLKLDNEHDVVEWTCALKDHVPKDSVWAMKQQRNEDTKNEKFLHSATLQRAACNMSRIGASHCGGC